MQSTFSLAPHKSTQQLLTLQGSFPPHWPGNLTNGLAAYLISVDSGKARKQRFEWDACLILDFSRYIGTPEEIDFVELATIEPVMTPGDPIRLSDFSIQRLPTGDLEVHLSGPDQIGFLAHMIRKMTFLNLIPREFDIDTVGGTIQDRFVLGGIGNMRPTPAAMDSLEKALQELK